MTEEWARSYPRIELSAALNVVQFDVIPERWNQLKKWGVRGLPDGTDSFNIIDANEYRLQCQREFANGEGSWLDVLLEEVYEASAETAPEKLRTELVQVAAVAIAWIEDIDKRQLTRIREAEELKELAAEAELPFNVEDYVF